MKLFPGGHKMRYFLKVSGVVACVFVMVKQLNAVVYPQQYATSGSGTSVSPWTGWESALNGPVNGTACGQTIHFNAGFYSTASNFSFTGSCSVPVAVEGEGSGNTVLTFTGTGTPTLAWHGPHYGGRLSGITVVVNSLVVDGLQIDGMAGFSANDLLIKGTYNGTGGTPNCILTGGSSGC
jgi:hypothetical protein